MKQSASLRRVGTGCLPGCRRCGIPQLETTLQLENAARRSYACNSKLAPCKLERDFAGLGTRS